MFLETVEIFHQLNKARVSIVPKPMVTDGIVDRIYATSFISLPSVIQRNKSRLYVH